MIGGLLVEVTALSQGSHVTADVLAGATELPIDDGAPFDPVEGGTIEVGEARYDYTGVVELAEDAAVLYLAEPLTADVVEQEPVEVVHGDQVALTYSAWVDFGEGDAVPVPIGYEQRDKWPIGAYDPPVPVQVADDLSRLEDAPGRTPVLDLSYADPTTIPEPVPVEAPTVSPAIKVTGMATGLMVTTEPIAPTTMLDYLIDGLPVKMGTRSTAEFLTLDGNGQELEAETDYSVTVVARNAAGSAAPSDPVLARLDPAVDAEFISAIIQAGFVLAGAITVGNITITPGGEDDPGGILIPLVDPETGQPAGKIHFPADGSPAVITAKLTAKSLQTEDNVRILGTNNSIEGSVELADGVVAPKIAPTVVGGLGVVTSVGAMNTRSGLTYVDDAPDRWAYCLSAPGLMEVREVSTSGTMVGGGVMAAGFTPNTVAKIGETWYVLGTINGQWRVHVYNASWVKVGDWDTTYRTTSGVTGHVYNPVICADGTGGLLIAYWNVNNDLRVRQFTTAGVMGSWWQLDDNWPGFGVTGVQVGTFDFGAPRLVLSWWAGVRVFGFDTTLASGATQARYAANDFNVPSTNQGVTWNSSAGVFNALTNDGRLYRLGTSQTASSKSITYTWFDSTGPTTHETPPSPPTVWTWPARSYAQIETAPINDKGGVDDVDSVRIYIDDKLQPSTALSPESHPTGFTEGVSTYWFTRYDTTGTPAPLVNGFLGLVGGTGHLTSTGESEGSPTIALHGDGSGRAGPFHWNGDGSGGVGDLAWNADGSNPNDTGWINLSLLNGWATSGGLTPQYRRKNGTVYLRGRVANGTVGSVIASLPIGFRPTQTLSFTTMQAVVTGGASAGTAHTHNLGNSSARLDVTPGGSIDHGGFLNSYVSLDGVAFLTD